MPFKNSLVNYSNWKQEAEQYLIQGNYGEAASLYERAIEIEPSVKSHYWHLGLMLLLQGQEAEAQISWFIATMVEADPNQVDLWTAELLQVLQTEAERREALGDYQVAWALRQHMKEIAPEDINNLLHIIQLSFKLQTFTGEKLASLGVIELLQTEEAAVDSKLLLQVLQSLLVYAPFESSVFTFAEACLYHAHQPQELIEIVMLANLKIAYSERQPSLASRFAELCLRLAPDHVEVLTHLASFYQNAEQYLKGIEIAKQCYNLAETLPDKISANHLLLRGLMSASGSWEQACSTLEHHQSLLLSLIAEQPTNLARVSTVRLFTSAFFFPYFDDNPQSNRSIQNKISCLCQENVNVYEKELVGRHRQMLSICRTNRSLEKKVLKIGYISHCFKRHSVAWISRWVFQHHNKDSFKIHIYSIDESHETDEFVQNCFFNNTYKSYKFGFFDKQILEQIQQDEIDILVDLDSITLDVQCEIMSIKPAPIQVTWLGWDASGLPTVDYFIADPYVLPESAQDYYTEQIWRLPQTYVAVDGFEVDVPTLRRDQLDVPGDAIVYFMAQKGYKRHPENVRLQMRILKEVPKSYLLIKGLADVEASKNFFEQIAEEEGVDGDRLRFLPTVYLEATHRANLGIADVVLDTYPYNGATTTLETLWMGIPLVTRVGQQFAARNSYTMMMNVGVTEGIAWTNEEYIEWGVRLGKDEALRQKVAWKLKASRQTSPLWNARQFTREMEKAYQQMWQRYVEAG